jgi:hypothetical protein
MLHAEAQFSSLGLLTVSLARLLPFYAPCTGRIMRHLEAERMWHLRAQATKSGAEEHPAVME